LQISWISRTARARKPVSDAPIVLFDGVCNLCNRLTRFVIEHDPAPARFRLATLQSEAGRSLLRAHGLPEDDLDTFVLVEGDRAWVRSTAALRLLALLGPPWSLLAILRSVPRPLRDAVYRWIARHRYAWWGKREQCMVPTPDVRSRFLP
jgi:predicted DCC family thiol-disulfide oxidoreductase YuxK